MREHDVLGEYDVVIIGGGAAGLAAAAFLNPSIKVAVLERNEKAGRKLYLTGKGRCNITNLCEREEFLNNVPRGQRFLFSAVSLFPPKALAEFFNSLRLEIKTERGNRIFPLSDKASDVTNALLRQIQANKGAIITNTKVNSVKKDGEYYNVYVNNIGDNVNSCFRAKYVILATGGKSYPLTGSDGNGYGLAKSFNHTIVEPLPSLTGLIFENHCELPQGLTLKNVSATLENKALKLKYSEFGEMLFTDDGVSGPIILTLSSLFARDCQKEGWNLSIDLKPALSYDALDSRVLRDFDKNINRNIKNSLDELLPKSLIPFIINYAGIDENKKINSLTKAERERLLNSLKNLTFAVDSKADINKRFNEAIITSGGVSLTEINPKTMESKLSQNLFVIGEMLDADAFTGGFNLQIAWSTAYACATAVNSRFISGD